MRRLVLVEQWSRARFEQGLHAVLVIAVGIRDEVGAKARPAERRR